MEYIMAKQEKVNKIEITEELAEYCAEIVANYSYINEYGDIVTNDGSIILLESLDLSGFNINDKEVKANIVAIEKVYASAVSHFRKLSHYKYGITPIRLSEEGMQAHIEAITTLNIAVAILGEESISLNQDDRDRLHYEASTNKLLTSICDKLVGLVEEEKPFEALLKKFKDLATREKAISSTKELNDIYKRFGIDKAEV